jgi:PII-like signaling protein
VKGKILDSKIIKIKDTSGADGATIYRAKVHYAYSIDGKEYFSYNLNVLMF